MKKLNLMLAALTVASTASAGTRVLYSQNFETVESPAAAGWTSPNNDGGLSIGSDDYGHFLQYVQSGGGDRNAYVQWGDAIYVDGSGNPIVEGTYSIEFLFSPAANSVNKNWNNGVNLFTDTTPKANTIVWNTCENWLFDMTQLKRDTEDTTSMQFYFNGDESDSMILDVSGWYNILVEVNPASREASYYLYDIGGELLKEGTRTVPEEISMYAEGINLLASRDLGKLLIDDIKVSTEISGDYANAPSITLKAIGVENDNENLNYRAYNINFGEEETLHIIGTDGVAEDDIMGGNYLYETTTSGTLTAWTTYGEATSEKVEIAVDCAPYALPEAAATVTSVGNGFVKTYTLTVDNSNVPLVPQIFIGYTFVGEGGEYIHEDEVGTGSKLTVTEKGVLTLETKAFGYQSTTSQVDNNQEFTLSQKLDFVHMAVADIEAKGFSKEEDLNSSATSGEGNWTARKGMFYYDATTATTDDEGNTVYTAVYPFGFVAEDDTEHVIHRYKINSSKLTENDYYASVFPGIEIWKDYNAQWKQSIGLVLNTMKQGDAEDGNGLPKAGTVSIKVPNLQNGDFVVVKKLDNYGRNTEHPVLNPGEEYNLYELANISEVYAAKEETVIPEGEELPVGTGKYSVNFDLYRIDTALVGVEIYKGDDSGVNDVIIDSEDAVKNTDNGFYTIDGIRYDKPMHNGIYIHQGKKVYINK